MKSFKDYFLTEIAFKEEPSMPPEDRDLAAAKTALLNLALQVGEDKTIKLGPNMLGGGEVKVFMVKTKKGYLTIQQINTLLDDCENVDQVAELGNFLGLIDENQT